MSLLQKSSLSLAFVALLNGCQPDIGSNHRNEQSDAVVTLRNAVAVYDGIHQLGQVNWYAYQVDAEQALLAVDIDSATQRADVDLLATLYRKNEAGEFERLYADHATENSMRGAKIQMVYPFDKAETVYVAVRDLMDDEASDSEYRIKISQSNQDSRDNSFDGAQDLLANDDQQCPTDRIDTLGDIDTFQFSLDQASVVNLSSSITAPDDSPLRLQMKLFNANKQFIRSTTWLQQQALNLYENLPAGDYFLVVEDYGRDHFDLSARYRLCLTTDEQAAKNNDDSLDSAQTISTDHTTHQGQLAYSQDSDWFSFDVAVDNPQAIPLLAFTMQGNSSSQPVIYQLLDQNDNIVFSFEQPAGSTEVSHQIKVTDGQYRLQVNSDENLKAPIDYGFSLQQSDVFDADDLGKTNNQITNATPINLPDSGWIDGKISYLSDIDWYIVEVPLHNSRYQRLAIQLQGEQTERVDYQLQVVEDEITETLVDPIHADAVLDLKTSVLIAPGEANQVKRFYVKVSDQFARKSDPQQGYQLRVQLQDIARDLAGNTPAKVAGQKLVFADESTEQNHLANNTAPRLNIEHNGYVHKNYAANTALFQFRDPNTASAKVTRTQQGEKTIIQFPWVAGYIDYAHDQDWYELDLQALGEIIDGNLSYNDSKWVYNIAIDLVANGSDAEYQWRLYRDGGNNLIIRDRKNNNDGFFATNGDDDLSINAIDITTSQAENGNTFYVGSRWKEKIYLAVIDANYVKKPTNKQTNERSDVDWSSHNQPYYIRVTLEYIPGQDQP